MVSIEFSLGNSASRANAAIPARTALACKSYARVRRPFDGHSAAGEAFMRTYYRRFEGPGPATASLTAFPMITTDDASASPTIASEQSDLAAPSVQQGRHRLSMGIAERRPHLFVQPVLQLECRAPAAMSTLRRINTNWRSSRASPCLVQSAATAASLPSVRPSRPIALRAAPVASMCLAAFARPRNGMLL